MNKGYIHSGPTWNYHIVKHTSYSPPILGIHDVSFSLLPGSEQGTISRTITSTLKMSYVLPAEVYATSIDALRELLQQMEHAVELPILTPREFPASGWRIIRREYDLRFRYLLCETSQYAALSAYLDIFDEIFYAAAQGRQPYPTLSPVPFLSSREDPGDLKWTLKEMKVALELPIFDACTPERSSA